MSFNEHIQGNKLSLKDQKVDIKELIGFLQKNKHITELSLISCKIGEEGAKALANGNLTNLTTLNLQSNNIGYKGAEALAKSENLRDLTTLDLDYNNIGHKGAEALAKSENLKNLTGLHLVSNNIGYKGAEVLATSENLQNLTGLHLMSNNIGEEGAKALANGNLINLIDLHLCLNNIGEEGAKALLNSDNFPNLRWLSFHLWENLYVGNKVDLLQKIENVQRSNKAIIIGCVCGAITVLTIHIGCGIAGVELSILAIAVAAGLVIGSIAGVIEYLVLKPSDELDTPTLEVANRQIGAGVC